MQVGKSGAEQAVDVRHPVHHGLGIDSLRAVLHRHHERQDAVVLAHPPPDDEGPAIPKEARLDHVERNGRRGLRIVQERHHPLEDALRIALEASPRHGEFWDRQERGDQRRVGASADGEASMDRGHREGAQLARRRKRVRDRPPDLLADITAQRLAKLKAVSARSDPRSSRRITDRSAPRERTRWPGRGRRLPASVRARRYNGCRGRGAPC